MDGATYKWAARACTSVGCSPWSAEQSLTVRLQPLPALPAAQSLVIGDAALSGASAATDCDTPGCVALPDGRLHIGTVDGHPWATRLKADLAALPKGARVTSAKLSLTRADCTAPCEAQKPAVFELSGAWTPAQSGKELLTAAGTDAFASGASLAETDLGMLVQSWIDRGANEGLALTVPDTAAGAVYHSAAAADAAQRPKLTIEYLPPTVPGAISEIVPTAGDTGLLATWNAPLDAGANGDVTYVAKAEKSDGTVAGTWEGTAQRAVFTGLDNTLSYRVSVTPKNAVGNGPVTRSVLVQGAAVTGGATRYTDYVQAYLSARNKVATGVSLTAADATAESPHGTVFGDVLGVQEGALVGAREAMESKGQAYVGASAALTETMVGKGATADRVVVRTTVVQTLTLRVDGVDQVSEDKTTRRFVFTVTGGAAKLESESDDTEAGQTLSPTAAAGVQVAAAPGESTGEPADETGAVEFDADGFPVSGAPEAGATTARYAANVRGSGTANWAWNNTGIKWDYGQDCTNFVSKALFYGGGMKTRTGWYTKDSAWWRNPSWVSWPKNSYTWSAAENLRRHFGYRSKSYIANTYSLRPGDILFFKWKRDSVFNHASVVTGNNHGQISVAQHGLTNHTTLQAIISRYKGTSDPITKIVMVRPVGAS
ncbi:amidase domain-containing protein [Streptomyces sp. NPDC048349]|uniref:amidase domain-containing protein n=1 Tax=Streptomyces sp. NPDC048349 TaxID=3155486 RepID=UPI00342A8BB1